jgi:hypothetical protein
MTARRSKGDGGLSWDNAGQRCVASVAVGYTPGGKRIVKRGHGRTRTEALLKAGDVLAAGMRLEPTGRNPRHFTVGFDDLERGVQRLASRPHQVAPNAYHDA